MRFRLNSRGFFLFFEFAVKFLFLLINKTSAVVPSRKMIKTNATTDITTLVEAGISRGVHILLLYFFSFFQLLFAFRFARDFSHSHLIKLTDRDSGLPRLWRRIR